MMNTVVQAAMAAVECSTPPEVRFIRCCVVQLQLWHLRPREDNLLLH